jgi:hypothetical protein
MGLLLGLAMFALAGGCNSQGTNPCMALEQSGWKCNLQVVEAFHPKDFIIVKNGQTQPLAANAEGFKIHTDDSNIQNATGKSDWSFDLKAEVPIPGATANPNAQLTNAGATSYSLTFSKVKIKSLASDANDTAIKSYQDAKRLAEQLIDALAVNDRNTLGQDGAQVYLVTQTIEAAVDYTFTGSGTVGASGGAAIRQVTASGQVTTNGSNTATLSFSDPKPIAYRALLMAVEKPALNAPTRITVKDTGDFVTIPAK